MNYCALEFMSCQRFVLTYLQPAELGPKWGITEQ
jgi:hypothetical protein